MSAEKRRIDTVIPWFRDGILLMGLIFVFPIVYIILFIVIQMGDSPFWDQIASISSLARCALLISILWTTLKDGMIENSRSFVFAKLLIILSEVSLIATFAHSIVSIKNTIQSSQVVHRPLIFLLTISTLEFLFNFLLIRIVHRVHFRSKFNVKCTHQESARQFLEDVYEKIETPHLDQSEEIVNQRKKFTLIETAHFDRIFEHYSHLTVQGKMKDRLESHSHRHLLPKFVENSWREKVIERKFYEKKENGKNSHCYNCRVEL